MRNSIFDEVFRNWDDEIYPLPGVVKFNYSSTISQLMIRKVKVNGGTAWKVIAPDGKNYSFSDTQELKDKISEWIDYEADREKNELIARAEDYEKRASELRARIGESGSKKKVNNKE